MAAAAKIIKHFDKDGSESMTLDEFLAMVMEAEGISAK
jgi:Ca2+-binding EF-hand superfamily protein